MLHELEMKSSWYTDPISDKIQVVTDGVLEFSILPNSEFLLYLDDNVLKLFPPK